MKRTLRVFLTFFAVFLTLSFTIDDAQARRLGGGRSFGMQRQITKSPARQNPAQNQATQPQKSWAGPLAGLAAGLGLGMLASHLGLGEGFGSLLLILLVIGAAVFAFSMFSKKKQPQQAFAYAANRTMPPSSFDNAQPSSSLNHAALQNFNAEEFVRHAKINFIRLQAANDAMNAADIREFVAPEVFAEIKMDWDERGHLPQETDVQNLNAEVLDVTEESERYIVSVLFSGKIRENNANLEPFSEIWHMTKPKNGGGWMISGIEQNH